ncbi:hypothetical protein DVW87_12350 [Sphingomonas aracearum]|uniref:Uncharacterized protein n=1 Tax=Sphingomonas aracearum TaxID=2283317 RepID=A0A369VWF5_9SPHN|nr:hypothetical protein DVW87_12350 [Sphingomonas aracearum]
MEELQVYFRLQRELCVWLLRQTSNSADPSCSLRELATLLGPSIVELRNGVSQFGPLAPKLRDVQIEEELHHSARDILNTEEGREWSLDCGPTSLLLDE